MVCRLAEYLLDSRWAWRETALTQCVLSVPKIKLVCPRVLTDETSSFSTLAIFTTFLLLSIASYAAAFVWSTIVTLRLTYAVLLFISILTVLMTVAVCSTPSFAAVCMMLSAHWTLVGSGVFRVSLQSLFSP